MPLAMRSAVKMFSGRLPTSIYIIFMWGRIPILHLLMLNFLNLPAEFRGALLRLHAKVRILWVDKTKYLVPVPSDML